jgi:Uma2 family endonuclease
MTTTTTQRMTAEEFYDWVHRPENAARSFELDRGEIVEMSRPGERHGFVCGNVARILGNYTFQRRKGYVCANDTGILWERGPDSVKGPDVVYFEQTRRFEDLNPKYPEEIPLLAVEVLSPNDRITAVNRRIIQFLDWDVSLVWLVDPEECAVSVYRGDRSPRVFAATEELTDELLPGFSCRVGDLFFLPGEEAPAAP